MMFSRSYGIAKAELHAGLQMANIAESTAVQRVDSYLMGFFKVSEDGCSCLSPGAVSEV